MGKVYLADLGELEGISPGHGICRIIKGIEIAIFRSRDNQIYAIENKCPHRQGPLVDGIIGDGKVICPLHGHKFDLTTGKGSEGNECVRVFKSWIQQDQIILELPCELMNGGAAPAYLTT